jgi:hypothetical protein
MSNKSISLGSVTLRGKYTGNRAVKVIQQMNRKGGLIIEQHVLRALRDQGFVLDLERDNKSVYNPEALWDVLKKYGTFASYNIDERCWNDAWAITFKIFGGDKTLERLVEKEDLLNSVKLDKASGAPLFMKKADAFELDYERMVRFSRGDCAAQPCTAYHRVQHGGQGPKTRLVWGYPLHMTLLEAKYLRPLIDHFLAIRSPIAFGLHRHELASRLVPIENMGVRMCFDFSGYDSSVSSRLISNAYNVLKTHFRYVDEIEWDRMVHYAIHTPILMPDGNIYVKHRGIASGSLATNLIGSICNFFATMYAYLRLTNKPVESNKILVLGDDGISGIDVYIPIQRWASVFKELGLTINVRKSLITRFGDDVEFLGHTWTKGLVNRDLHSIAKRMAFPEKHLDIEDTRKRIVTRVLAYGSDALNAHLIIQRWSHYKGPDIVAMYFRDVLNEPLLGWKEFQTGDRSLSTIPNGALNQAYIGLLT